jgi:chromosome segregation ATPase
MPDVDLARRVEMLEETLNSLRQVPDDLKALNGRMTRVDVQMLQLRTEMREEFSAVRGEMATKADLAEGLAAARIAAKDDLAAMRRDLANNELADLKRELREDIAGMGGNLAQIILDTQHQVTRTQRLIAEGQSQTRMMFEEVVSRLNVLGEGKAGPAA